MSEPASNSLLLGNPQEQLTKGKAKPIVKDLQVLYDTDGQLQRAINLLQEQIIDIIAGATLAISILPNNSGNDKIGTLTIDVTNKILTIPQTGGYIDGKVTVIVNGVTLSPGDGYVQSGQIGTTKFYTSVTLANAIDTAFDTAQLIYLV
jgi:hypothetical protein